LRQSVPSGTSVREEVSISMRPHGNPTYEI